MAVKKGKNKKVFSLIAWVILSAKADNITGKFETKARILAMRQHLLAAGDLAIQGKFFSVILC